MHSSTADQELVRKVNTSIVFTVLRLYSPISRAEVAMKTGLNRSTVSSIVNELIDQGYVLETNAKDTKVGRPGISLVLNPGGGAVIGIEIGVGFISIILTDFTAGVLWRERLEIDAALPQITILQQAESLIEQAIEKAAALGYRVLGIGLGVPGLVDTIQGKMIFAPNLKWENVPFRLMWTNRFHLPLYIENEANAAALGEYYFGVAKGVDNFIYLSSGVGLGAGIIIGGQLLRGVKGFASEVGHMRMDSDGEKCGCGRFGCWETQVGPSAVLRRVKEQLKTTPDSAIYSRVQGDLSRLSFGAVVDVASHGDPVCRKALDEVAVNLGMGIANLINIFNPALVVLGGTLCLGISQMMPTIEKTVKSEALMPAQDNLRLAGSAHGADACVFGAVAIVLDEILREAAIV